MVRLVAMDLDGTLLDDQKQIPRRNMEAIEAAKQRGVYIIPCSGRSPKSIIRIVRELGLDEAGQYYITSNGACIMEGGREQAIYTCTLPPGAARELIRIGRKYGEQVNPHIYVGDQFIVERYLSCTRRYEQLSGSQCRVVESLDAYEDEPMLKMLYNNIGEPSQLIELQKKLEGKLPEHVQMFRSSDFLLEFVNEAAGKWNAVAYIAKRLGIENKEILCIGDNENDLSMIQGAGYGAAPRNAVELVRRGASYVSSMDNNHGAVGEILEHFEII